jgi:hypothetical protein
MSIDIMDNTQFSLARAALPIAVNLVLFLAVIAAIFA